MLLLEIIFTIMMMLIIAVIRMLFKINKTLGRLEEKIHMNQRRISKIEKDHEVHICKEE